jgi:hypothetical protein
MSKIALTPSATGTGVFTISSPATNTDRTLTLPDEAGSIVVNTATGIDVTGTVTADGLTVDGGASHSVVAINNGVYSMTLNQNTGGASFLDVSGNNYFEIDTNSVRRARFEGDGDFALYEDTGTTAKFFWDASAEELQLGGNLLALTPVTTGTTGSRISANGGGMLRLASGGSDKMYVLDSGNVGIGTSSPLYELDVGSGSGSNSINIFSGSTDTSSVYFTDSTTGVGSYIGRLAYNHTADAMLFTTNASERMRIDSSGNVLVGKTSTSSVVAGILMQPSGGIDATRSGARVFLLNRLSSTGTIIDFQYNDAGVGSISVTGSSTAYNTSSDYRLKTDAQPMTGASERVLALKPVNFAWKVDGTRVDGFLAHEAQEIVPEAVTGTKDAMRDEEYEVTAAVYEDIIIAAVLDEEGNELEAERTEQRLVSEAVMGTRSVPDMQGIDQSKLVPLLTAALQEALNKIEAMEIRLAALEAV